MVAVEDSEVNDSIDMLTEPTPLRRSSEGRAIRLMGCMCLIVMFATSSIAIGVAFYAWINYPETVAAAASMLGQADRSLTGKLSVQNAARNRLNSYVTSSGTQNGSAAALRTAALQTLHSELQDAVNAANAAQGRVTISQQNLVDTRKDTPAKTWVLCAVSALAVNSAVALVYAYFRSEQRRKFEDKRLVEELSNVQMSGPSGQPVNPLDLIVLWNSNREQLSKYHKLVLNYASASRQTNIFTLVSGFVIIVIVSVMAVLAHSIPAAIATSIGAMVTGFITRAVLQNGETSSREVLAFSAHPRAVERMLAIERLIVAMRESPQVNGSLLETLVKEFATIS